MQELEKLLQDVREKRISMEDAGHRLVEFIYRNKIWFGLNKLKEDELHDFLLKYYGLFSRLFKNYDSSKGDFSCYLIGNVSHAYMGWKRTSARRIIKQITLEEIEWSRLKSEQIYETADASLYVSDLLSNQIPSFKKSMPMMSYRKKTSPRVKESKKGYPSPKTIQDTVLVLMVKSWFLIEGEILEKISALTQVPTESLMEILRKTRAIMADKSKKIDMTIKNRNESYYFMEHYRVADNYTEELSYIINRKRIYHSNNWKKFNEKLARQNKNLIPSNKRVGLILGMDSRRVQYIMDRADKNMDIMSLNWYYIRHEDLFGKRKLE